MTKSTITVQSAIKTSVQIAQFYFLHVFYPQPRTTEFYCTGSSVHWRTLMLYRKPSVCCMNLHAFKRRKLRTARLLWILLTSTSSAINISPKYQFIRAGRLSLHASQGVYMYFPWMGSMLVHRSVTTQHLIRRCPFIHLSGERHGESKVSYSRTQHNVPAKPGLEPGPLDPKFSAPLTMRPPRLPH